MRTKPRSPLEPIATLVSLLLTVIVAGTAIAAITTVFGVNSWLGFGGGAVYTDVAGYVCCPDVPPGLGTARDNVTVNLAGYRYFVAEPDIGQRLWYTLTVLPAMVLFVGALLLASRLIRGAQREGIFTVATAARLRTLGWFLLVGAVVAAVVEKVAALRLYTSMLTDEVDWARLGLPSISWTVVLTAAGLLTFARIMRIGAEMRRDLEGTV